MKQINIQDQSFHGIPADDALMAVYSSYYIGAKALDPTVAVIKGADNTAIAGRAENAFNMTDKMNEYFSKADSPWVVVDDSQRWMERNGKETKKDQIKEIGNGYFVTLYHKESGKLMVVAPGMESDEVGTAAPNIRESWISRAFGDIGDIAFNVVEGMKGGTHMRQSKAIGNYMHEIEDTLRRDGLIIQDGSKETRIKLGENENIRDRVVLGGHSSGTIPMMTLAGDGFKSLLVEPRAYSDDLEKRMLKNLETMNHGTSREQFVANQDANTINLRSSFHNSWNANILRGEDKTQYHGTNMVYHRNGAEQMGNISIGGQHRVEESIPGLLNQKDAKGFVGSMTLVTDAVPGKEARSFVESLTAPLEGMMKKAEAFGANLSKNLGFQL